MSELPAGWALARISDIAEVNPPRNAKLPAEALVSFVPMASVEAESGRIDVAEARRHEDLRTKSYRPFAEGDVLFAKITPCMENGKAAVARRLINGHGFGSTEFHVLRPRPGISADYLLYYLLQSGFRHNAARNMKGTAGQLRVPASYLSGHPIPVPPVAEQVRIVAAIKEQFSRLDAGVAALERVRQNLKRMRAAVLRRAVTGQLISHPVVADDTSSDLPHGWNWHPLGEIITRLRNGIFVSRPVSDPIGPAILRISAVRPLSLDISDVRYVPHPDKLDRADDFTLTDGDLLFTRYSGNPEYVGACAMVPPGAPSLLYPDKLIRVQVDRSRALPRFIEIAASAGRSREEIRRRVKTTAGQTGISGGDLRTVPFPVPPLDTQEVIITEVDRLLSCITTLDGEIHLDLHRSSVLRSSILAAAFSGKLVSQDPTDEPASVLLEHIAAERAAPSAPQPTRKPRQLRLPA